MTHLEPDGIFATSLSLLYLFSEVFGRPGFVVGRSLLLLPPLSLLQPMFVLRGLLDVPVLQSFGDALPQPPGNTHTEDSPLGSPPHAGAPTPSGRLHLDSVLP